jgi:hypothetical protein
MIDEFDEMFMQPKKVKHTTRVVHHRKESSDVCSARPSKGGCPFTPIKDRNTQAKYVCHSRKEAIQKYKEWLEDGDGQHLLGDLHELKDKVLGCWCKNEGGGGKSCHGDVLVELITKYCI